VPVRFGVKGVKPRTAHRPQDISIEFVEKTVITRRAKPLREGGKAGGKDEIGGLESSPGEEKRVPQRAATETGVSTGSLSKNEGRELLQRPLPDERSEDPHGAVPACPMCDREGLKRT